MTTRALLHYDPSGKSTLPALAGWSAKAADNSLAVQKLASQQCYAVGICSINATSALHPLEELVADTPIEWIAVLPPAGVGNRDIDRLISQSFYDYHTLPIDPRRLEITLGRAWGIAQLKNAARSTDGNPPAQYEMVGASPQMHALFRTIRKAAAVDAPVLLYGESGTGKELAARAIHERSQRTRGPFVAVNCAALPATLIHSELFGHERGSFTGAHKRSIGRIEAAAGGTVFLDEIGDLPHELQVTLLRFLQEKTIERIGGHQSIAVDVRVLAATNIHLEQAVAEGRFREDLYYRLNVLRITVPALRERESDIEILARFFFNKFRSERHTGVNGFSDAGLLAMQRHDWPGNVRELMSSVRRALLTCDGRLITPKDLGLDSRFSRRHIVPLEQCRDTAEKNAIVSALWSTGNNVSQAAAELEVSRMTLYRLMEKYQITGHCMIAVNSGR